MSRDLLDVLVIAALGLTMALIVLVVLSLWFFAAKFSGSGRWEQIAAYQPAPSSVAEEPSLRIEPDVLDDDVLDDDVLDDDELAVVISAALAAFLGEEMVVSSIRRIEDTATWSRTGRHDQMLSRIH